LGFVAHADIELGEHAFDFVHQFFEHITLINESPFVQATQCEGVGNMIQSGIAQSFELIDEQT
jgi:hypothetical protein